MLIIFLNNCWLSIFWGRQHTLKFPAFRLLGKLQSFCHSMILESFQSNITKDMSTLYNIHTYADYLLCCQEPRPGASSSQCVPTTVLRQKTTSRLLYWENHKGESHLVASRPELNQSIIIQVLFYLLSYFIVNAMILGERLCSEQKKNFFFDQTRSNAVESVDSKLEKLFYGT